MGKRNTVTDQNAKETGCFGWLFRVRKAVNERCAKARNALRRKLAREQKLDKPLTPDDLLNETGSPDLIITKVHVSPRPPTPLEEWAKDIAIDGRSPGVSVPDNHTAPTMLGNMGVYITADANGEPDADQVRCFVSNILERAQTEVQEGISNGRGLVTVHEGTVVMDHDSVSITSSVVSALATEAVRESMTNVIRNMEGQNMAIIDDKTSLSSDAISALAEAAVTESLSRVFDDENQSAKTPRSRTVTEVLERLQIDPDIGKLAEDGHSLPPCSP